MVGVAFAVLLESLALLVERPAVAFDDHAVIGEERVHLPAVERVVDERDGQPVLGHEGEEVVFEIGVRGVGGVLHEGVEQLAAGVAGIEGDDVLERREGEVAGVASVVDQALDLLLGQAGREIEGGPGGGGGGDAALPSEVAWL